MTGGRPGRDPRIAGRRERGPQRGGSTPPETRWTGTGGAELEELHVAEVVSRGGSRVSFRAAIAAVGLVGLLAVGFGAFGGRPQPSGLPVRSPAAVAPSPRVTEPPTPRITPFEPCAPETNVALPSVLLQVAGDAYGGAIEVLDANPDAVPRDLPEPGIPSPVSVGLGAGTAIVIDGARCALAWVIDYGVGTTIDVVSNGSMDPARSAQNRFELALADNPGRRTPLRAQLLFPGFSIRASWNVEVERLFHPAGELHWEDGTVSIAVEGCFTTVTYANGWREPTDVCESRGQLDAPKLVARPVGVPLILSGWPVDYGAVTCGHGIDDAFVPDDDGCLWTINTARTVVSVDFSDSFETGVWTLAIDACALDGPILGAQLCGTWYTLVRVE